MNFSPASKDAHLRFRPALENDLAWISGLQQKLYSANDAVPITRLKEWFQANPKGFFILENAKKEPLGQITFLPLKKECLDQYRMEGDGGMIEREILGSHLQTAGAADSLADLYLESLILAEEDRLLARAVLMHALPEMIARIRPGTRDGNIFALAATASGERWLTRMGFIKISRAEARRDRHNMFQLGLSAFLRHVASYQSKSEP